MTKYSISYQNELVIQLKIPFEKMNKNFDFNENLIKWAYIHFIYNKSKSELFVFQLWYYVIIALGSEH